MNLRLWMALSAIIFISAIFLRDASLYILRKSLATLTHPDAVESCLDCPEDVRRIGQCSLTNDTASSSSSGAISSPSFCNSAFLSSVSTFTSFSSSLFLR